MTYPPPHEPFSQSRRNSTLRTAHPVEPSSGANNLTAFLSNACPAQPPHLAHFAGTGHHSPPFLAQANHIPHQPHPRLSVYASIDAHVSRSSINFVIPRPSKIPFRLANHPHQATALTPLPALLQAHDIITLYITLRPRHSRHECRVYTISNGEPVVYILNRLLRIGERTTTILINKGTEQISETQKRRKAEQVKDRKKKMPVAK